MLHFRKSKHKMLPCFTSVFFSPDNLGAITSSEQDHELIESKGDWSRPTLGKFCRQCFRETKHYILHILTRSICWCRKALDQPLFFRHSSYNNKRSGKLQNAAICRRASCDVRATMSLDRFKFRIMNVKDPSPPPKPAAIC